MHPMNLVDLLNWLGSQSPVFKSVLVSPLGLIVVDLLSGTVSAFRQNVFDPKKLADFMRGDGLKYLVGLAFVGLSALPFGNTVLSFVVALTAMVPLSFGTVMSIIENVTEWLPQPVQTGARALLSDVATFEHEVLPTMQPTQETVTQKTAVVETPLTNQPVVVIPPRFTLPITQPPPPPSEGAGGIVRPRP